MQKKSTAWQIGIDNAQTVLELAEEVQSSARGSIHAGTTVSGGIRRPPPRAGGSQDGLLASAAAGPAGAGPDLDGSGGVEDDFRANAGEGDSDISGGASGLGREDFEEDEARSAGLRGSDDGCHGTPSGQLLRAIAGDPLGAPTASRAAKARALKRRQWAGLPASLRVGRQL